MPRDHQMVNLGYFPRDDMPTTIEKGVKLDVLDFHRRATELEVSFIG